MSLHQIWTMPATPIDHDALRRRNESRVAGYFHTLGIWRRSLGRLRAALAAPLRALRGYRAQRRTVRALQQLSDRALADIGVPRYMIDTVAHRAGRAAREKGRAWLTRHRRARRIRQEMAELARIDPALHADVGLRPHNFKDMAEAIVDGTPDAAPAPGTPSRAGTRRMHGRIPSTPAGQRERLAAARQPRLVQTPDCARCA